jgi:hypothetical protein
MLSKDSWFSIIGIPGGFRLRLTLARWLPCVSGSYPRITPITQINEKRKDSRQQNERNISQELILFAGFVICDICVVCGQLRFLHHDRRIVIDRLFAFIHRDDFYKLLQLAFLRFRLMHSHLIVDSSHLGHVATRWSSQSI